MPVETPLDLKKLFRSFGFAFIGIWKLVRSEQNARIHLLATVLVVFAGFIMGLDRYEWIVICIVVGMVWLAEACNTAIEKLVNLVSPERRPEAGTIKDIAAGGVLICAIIALIVAVIIFIPKIITICESAGG